jgi:hypothetical protein
MDRAINNHPLFLPSVKKSYRLNPVSQIHDGIEAYHVISDYK